MTLNQGVGWADSVPVTGQGRDAKIAETNAQVDGVRKVMKELVSAEFLTVNEKLIWSRVIRQSSKFISNLAVTPAADSPKGLVTVNGSAEVNRQALADVLAAMELDDESRPKLASAGALAAEKAENAPEKIAIPAENPDTPLAPSAPTEPAALSAAVVIETHTNIIGMEFILIPAGEFMMGSENGGSAERPVHRVTISNSFYLGKYEVTQEQWEAVMGNNPSEFKGRSNPVENVSWHDVQVFIKELNQKEGTNKYRLPTEAEWEYAARAGTKTDYSFSDDASQLGQYAWFDDNSGHTTHPVGQKKPNAWGLYDIAGNVYEWVQDWYDGAYYEHPGQFVDPRGPEEGASRVSRGGSWRYAAKSCRSADRLGIMPDFRGGDLGFRLAFSPGQ
jgi:formylglycine-generating enzyme required for sulfatase activity